MIIRGSIAWLLFWLGCFCAKIERLTYGYVTAALYQWAMRRSSEWQRPGDWGPWEEV